MNIVNDNMYDINEDEINEYITYMKKKMDEQRDFSLVFIDNDYIKELNKEYRQKNAETDVLTFVEDTRYYLGDILISYPKIVEQAKEYNHEIKREMYFLITHGFLHLLGYDHLEKEDEKIMFDKQNELLNNYGIRR